jgi:hypothetical protein
LPIWRREKSGAGGKPHRWLREAGVYAALYGIPLLVLFPFTRWRPDAEFQATTRSRAVEFTVGSYKKTGPFTRVCSDVTFERLSQVVLPAAYQWKVDGGAGTGGTTDKLLGGRIRFRHVNFQSVLLTPGTRARLVWYESSPNGVEMRLTYPSSVANPAAALDLDADSTVEFSSSSFSESGALQSGSIRISGPDQGLAEVYAPSDLHFPVSVSPCTQPAASTQAARGSVPAKSAASKGEAAVKAKSLPATGDIPLAPGSSIGFVTDAGESAILDGTNSVAIRNADRKETLFRGQRLEIGRLKDRSRRDPSTISVGIGDGLMVRVLGRAGIVDIDQADARPSVAEFLRAQRILSTWLATSILVGSALLTVASRVKLVRLDGK